VGVGGVYPLSENIFWEKISNEDQDKNIPPGSYAEAYVLKFVFCKFFSKRYL
jgi:hypothetical protein